MSNSTESLMSVPHKKLSHSVEIYAEMRAVSQRDFCEGKLKMSDALTAELGKLRCLLPVACPQWHPPPTTPFPIQSPEWQLGVALISAFSTENPTT